MNQLGQCENDDGVNILMENGSFILCALYQLGSSATQQDIINFISVWANVPRSQIQYEVMLTLKVAEQAGFLVIDGIGKVKMASFGQMLKRKNNAIVFKAMEELSAPATAHAIALYVASVAKVEMSVVRDIVAQTLEMAVQYGFLGKLHEHYFVDYDDLPVVNAKLHELLNRVPRAFVGEAERKRNNRALNLMLATRSMMQQHVVARIKRFTVSAKARSRITLGGT